MCLRGTRKGRNGDRRRGEETFIVLRGHRGDTGRSTTQYITVTKGWVTGLKHSRGDPETV